MKFLVFSAFASVLYTLPTQTPFVANPNEYVVLFKEDYSPNTAGLVGNLFQNEHLAAAKMLHEYSFGFAAELNSKALSYVKSLPEVAVVEENKIFTIRDVQKNAPSWGLPRISQREFSDKSTYSYPESAGIDVDAYVIDTGVFVEHSDFEGRAEFGFNAVNSEGDFDGNGHGTHVASTIAGAKYGVAKKANIIAVKVLNSYGSGSLSDVIKGIDWAAGNTQKTNKKSVANMSLGGGKSTALDMAVSRAIKAGLTMVVAAGNSQDDACRYSPANVDAAITVGATAVDDKLAYFSNYGKCVDILAPGHQITAAWIGSKTATNKISGTSMASPHVAGVVALYLGESNGLDASPAALKSQIKEFSTPNLVKSLPRDTPNLLVFNNAVNESNEESVVIEGNGNDLFF